jgi:hypothetical protein
MNKYILFLCLIAISCITRRQHQSKKDDSQKSNLIKDTSNNKIQIGGERSPKDYIIIDDSLIIIGNKNGKPIYDTIHNINKIR